MKFKTIKAKANQLATQVGLTALTAVATVSTAFAADADPSAAVISTLNTNMNYATAIITAAGTALIGLGFLAFVFRKGRSASNGKISG